MFQKYLILLPTKANVLLGRNRAELKAELERFRKIDASLHVDAPGLLHTIPGLKGAANMVILGRMFAETSFCSYENLEKGLRKSVPARKADLVDSNLKAIGLGMKS